MSAPGADAPAAWATQHDFLFKVLVIGDAGVGKTCLVRRFVDNEFTESYIATIGVDFKVRSIDIGGSLCKLQVWDTAGQERFRTLTGGYYRGANGAIIVYDMTDDMTFESVIQWLQEIDKHDEDGGGVSRVLIGNKLDLGGGGAGDAAARMDKSSRSSKGSSSGRVGTRRVGYEQAQELAQQMGVQFFECSARQGTHVEDAFRSLAEAMLRRAVEDGGGAGRRNTPAMHLPPAQLDKRPGPAPKRGCSC